MKDRVKGRILVSIFSDLEDPRSDKSKLHPLTDIIGIVFAAVMSGIEGWENIELWARARQEWLREFLDLPHGIPSHDTIERVFESLDPKAFQRCFLKWLSAVCDAARGGETIALDGKTLRRSFDRAKGASPLHLVGAWSTRNRVWLGHVTTDGRGNEIQALRELLGLVALRGNTITIDAIGAQKDICQTIRTARGDYCIGLKANQPTLFAEAEQRFGGATPQRLDEILGGSFETTEKGHGRVETRRYWLAGDLRGYEGAAAWPGLQAIGIAETITSVGDKRTADRRFFLVSFANDRRRFGETVRAHWGIEASHWILDVVFGEDSSRVRRRRAAENLATIRRASTSLLRQLPGKRTLKQRRMLVSLEPGRLAEILAGTSAEG